jgi:hypothetical protein
MSEPTPARSSSDRNLLFGILAQQLGFISRDALVEAMHAWALDKTRPVGEILVERAALMPEQCRLLEALAAAHRERHGGSAEQSLAAALPPAPLRHELGRVADADVQASLLSLSADSPPRTRRRRRWTTPRRTRA